MTVNNIQIPISEISKLCQKWQITELAIFGSVLRDDFNPNESDIDILVTFAKDSNISWNIIELKEELENIFKRPVDIVSKRSIEKSRNPFRKEEILKSYQVIYEQAA